MKPHPIAEIFPDIEGAEFSALVEDIRKNGCLQPLVMYQGKILDGRNRWRACQKLGIKPKTVDYRGDDPVGFVLSLNLTRRHLTDDQRAMVGAKIAALGEGRPKTPPIGGVKIPSTKETAKALQVAPRRIERARKIENEGTPELKEAVNRGDVSMSAAAVIAEAPAKVQKEAVKDHGKTAPAIAKKIAEEKKEAKPASPIKTMGLEVPDAVLERAEKEQALVDKLDRLITEINRTYTEYETIRGGRNGLRAGQHYASALRDAVTAFKSIRGNRPASVCPHCKLWPELQKTCAACRCAGFVGDADLERVEKVLLVEGDEAGVWVNGQWRTLISLRGDDF
jgi:hypothetical protein